MPDPLTVHLHPTKHGSLYVEVMVYPTLAAMRRAGRKFGVKAHDRTLGWARSYRRVYPTREDRVAQVGLARNWIGVGLVSHEMTHAALMYLQQKTENSKPPIDEPFEPLCYAVGYLTNGFYHWAKKMGLY